jgi:hypothetical protein
MSWRGNQTNNVPNLVQESDNRSEVLKSDNRATHTRRDTDVQKNFSITIRDIDETLSNALDSMKLSVIDNGSVVNVPTLYASPEKWKAVRHDGFMRDGNGNIILPVIAFHRTSMESDKTMAMFNRYLKYNVIKLYSRKNQYTQFSRLTGKNVPVNEVYSVTMPDYMNFTYKFIVWTEKIDQMNSIIERINFEANDYWGTSTGLRFRTEVNSYSHTTEVESGDDRVVKTEFDLVLRGYLLPEMFSPGLDGYTSTTKKLFTPKKVIFNVETVSRNGKLPDDVTSDKWRSQLYPNLRSGTEPAGPPSSYQSNDEFNKNLSVLTGSHQ